jgi:hypothetical protein
MKEVKRLLIVAVFVMLVSSVVWGQQTSAVTGVVTDSTGAVIRGVDVKITDTKTSAEQTTKTNDQGVYSFVKMAPGTGYKLSFSAQGFDSIVVTNVTLGVGVTETHNATLTVGQVTNTVEVTTQGEATLNTTDVSIGNVISTRRLQELPIQIRNTPAALIGLQAGVIGSNVGTGNSNRVGSVTGSRADQGNITVDGIDANDQATGQFAATVGNAPIDSIQEFRAVSTNPGAADGRSSGGQVMLVTKGGTNVFHGSLREYNRTAATAANTFFNNKTGVDRPQLTRNQFGGSLGGPLYLPRFGEGGPAHISGKDKIFFFFDYEGRRDAQGVAYLRTVPLDSFRNGSLAYLNNTPGCPTNARLNTRPECITILSPGQVAALDPKGIGANQALLNFINQRYPHANDLSAGNGINTGGFRFNAPSHRADNTYTTRIDWNATEKQKVFGLFRIGRLVQTDTVNTVAEQFPGDPETGQILIRDYSWAVGHTWTINTNLVNQATVGVSRSGLDFPAKFAPAFPNSFTFGTTALGLSAPYASISSQDRFVRVPTIRDDLTWTKGSHTLTFGGVVKPINSESGIINDFNFPAIGLGGVTTTLNASLRPTTIGSGTTRTGNYDAAFAFLLGRYAQVATNFNYNTSGNAFAPGTGKTRNFRYNEYEFYGQDSWKVRNNLTLTLGLRWQYYPPPYETNKFQAGNNVDYDALFSARLKNAANGVSGISAEPLLSYDLIGAANDKRGFYEPDKNNFAPRLGFAWNPSFKGGLFGKAFGDRKTVIRGGASIVYDRVAGGITFIQDQATYIFDNSKTTTFGSANARTALLNDPRFTGINSLPVQNVAPTITRPFTPFVDANGVPTGNGSAETNYTVSQNFKIPYAYTYSFGIQRELPGNFILEVEYVGRQGRKLFAQADASQILNFKDPASGQFMLAAFNALQAQLKSGAAITAQPWFENQIGAALGAPCARVFGSSCTAFLANNVSDLISIGDTSDTVQALYANGLLNPNVGMSSQFSTNAYITNQGSSSYNGLLTSLRKRLSRGLEFDFNYTFSHSIDNQSSVVNTVFGGLVCDATNLRTCRGNSDFDIRHLVNANWIYELPLGHGRWLGKNAPGWLNTVIGGWNVSGIYTYRSGIPFSTSTNAFPVGFVVDSPAVLTGGATNALLQKIHDSGSSGSSTIQFFGDPTAALAAVQYPNHGQIGNRNILRSAGFWNVDTAVLKSFNLRRDGETKLIFRWEMYNAFNHNSFGLPDANIGSATFGQITSSASAAREMQFALRLQF